MQKVSEFVGWLSGRNGGDVATHGLGYTSTGAPGMPDAHSFLHPQLEAAKQNAKAAEETLSNLQYRIRWKQEEVDDLQGRQFLSSGEADKLTAGRLQIAKLRSQLLTAQAERDAAVDAVDDIAAGIVHAELGEAHADAVDAENAVKELEHAFSRKEDEIDALRQLQFLSDKEAGKLSADQGKLAKLRNDLGAARRIAAGALSKYRRLAASERAGEWDFTRGYDKLGARPEVRLGAGAGGMGGLQYGAGGAGGAGGLGLGAGMGVPALGAAGGWGKGAGKGKGASRGAGSGKGKRGTRISKRGTSNRSASGRFVKARASRNARP
jgi:hypothetical protein